MDITITKLDLRKLISEIIKQHQTTAAHREQQVILKCNTDKPLYVPGDDAAITEVVNNLISNALKFTDNGGSVMVNLQSTTDLECLKHYTQDYLPSSTEHNAVGCR